MTKTHSCGKKSFYGAYQKNLNEDRSILSAAKCWSVILVSRNITYIQIFTEVPGGEDIKQQWAYRRAYKFHHLILVICSEALDRIYMQDIQPFDGFSVVLKCMTLNEPEQLFQVKFLLSCLCEVI